MVLNMYPPYSSKFKQKIQQLGWNVSLDGEVLRLEKAINKRQVLALIGREGEKDFYFAYYERTNSGNMVERECYIPRDKSNKNVNSRLWIGTLFFAYIFPKMLEFK